FFSPAVGRELNHLNIHFAALPGGHVAIDRLDGNVGSGSFFGSATAEMGDGSWKTAHLQIGISNHHAVPVVTEGVDYGLVWGTATVDTTNKGGEVDVNVNLPTLRFELTEQDTAKIEKTDPKLYVTFLHPLNKRDSDRKKPAPAAVGGGPSPSAASSEGR